MSDNLPVAFYQGLGLESRSVSTSHSEQEESLSIGSFSILDNPHELTIERLSLARREKVEEVISDLLRCLRNEEDPVLRPDYQKALDKAETKRYPTYSEFKSNFARKNTLSIKQEINELNDQERRIEQEARKRDYNYTPTSYQPTHSNDLVKLQNQLLQQEDFLSFYKPNPESYFEFLKNEYGESSLGFYMKSYGAKVPMSARKKHSYVVGKTGCGKSELLKTCMYFDACSSAPERAVIAIDPHGDMVESLARNKYIDSERVVYIDPMMQSGFSPSINPFDIEDLSEENIAITVQELKRVLNILLQGAGTSLQMDALLSPCISVLLRRKGSNFMDLQRFMDDANNADLIELGKKSPNAQHARLFKDKFHSKQYESTKHGLYTRMQSLLNDPIFQNLISNKTTIHLNKLIEERKIILFRLSLGEGGSESMEAFGRFVVGMLRIIAIQRSPQEEHERTPTFVYVDEFQNFVSEDIETALTQLRKFKMWFTFAHQYTGQKIGTEMQQALYQSGMKIIGMNEAKSARSAGQQINVEPEEIMSLGVGEFYIQCDNSPAFKMKSRTFLMNRNDYAMSHEDWMQFKSTQIQKYYLSTTQVEALPEPREEEVLEVKAPNKLTPKYKL